jgi:hypothetical protein
MAACLLDASHDAFGSVSWSRSEFHDGCNHCGDDVTPVQHLQGLRGREQRVEQHEAPGLEVLGLHMFASGSAWSGWYVRGQAACEGNYANSLCMHAGGMYVCTFVHMIRRADVCKLAMVTYDAAIHRAFQYVSQVLEVRNQQCRGHTGAMRVRARLEKVQYTQGSVYTKTR